MNPRWPVKRFLEVRQEEGTATALNRSIDYLADRFAPETDNSSDSFKSFSYQAASEKVPGEAPAIVVGGAAVGGSTEKFLEMFESPTLHAIEPNPNCVEELEEKFGETDGVNIYAAALGSDHGEVEFNIHPHSSSSSVYETSELFMESYASGREREWEPESTIQVKQLPIDAITTSPDIIRLDIQGYELEALKGAERALSECSMVITKISFLPHYESQPLFIDIHQYLSDKGFQLYNLDAVPWFDEQISHGFAVYFSEEIYELNDEFPVNPFDYK